MTNDECQPSEGACLMVSTHRKPAGSITSIVILLSFLIRHSSLLWAAQPDPLLGSWLSSQSDVHTWSATLVQLRSFKTFAQPVTNHGRVWFEAPDKFRW